MKYVQIQINKIRSADGTRVQFRWPNGYRAEDYHVVCYEDRGAAVEFAVATTADDTELVPGITEVPKPAAAALIDKFIDTNISIDDAKLTAAGKTRESVKTQRKGMLA